MVNLARTLRGVLFLTAIVAVMGCPKSAQKIATTSAPKSALFEDITQKVGINFVQENGAQAKNLFFPETTPSGCALVDVNGDGWLDIVLIQSGSLATETPDPKQHPALYVSDQHGGFRDATAGSGLDVALGYCHGVAVGDYDNDGFDDLFITSFAGNRLFHNEKGSGKFTDTTKTMGLDKPHSTGYATSAAFGDYDNDGKLDLYVCYYCPWSKKIDKHCNNAEGQRDYCGPEVYPSDTHQLFHNEGTRFKDVSLESGIAKKIGRGLAVAFLDYNEDGKQDIYVANDLSGNFLWKNLGNGTFKDVGTEAGCSYATSGALMAGMGIGIADYDHSGHESVFVTNFLNMPNMLFKNTGDGYFEDVSAKTQVGPLHLPYLSFGCEFIDYDADGWQDVLTANGHVQLGGKDFDSMRQPKQLLRNEGGQRFAEISDPTQLGPLTQKQVARGIAVGDIDNDGKLDVLFSNQNDRPQLLRNSTTNGNHWISFRTMGTKSNADGYHAKITIWVEEKPLSQTVRSSSSYLSASDRRVYFGLGTAQKIDRAEIVWPSGTRDALANLPIDTQVVVTEGKGITKP